MATRKKPRKPIGQRIKDERSRRGWTQAKLARELNVTVTTISQWENGRAVPTVPKIVARLTKKLGVE
jgi:transcriptional regulator with XRE-family HTH domain